MKCAPLRQGTRENPGWLAQWPFKILQSFPAPRQVPKSINAARAPYFSTSSISRYVGFGSALRPLALSMRICFSIQ